MKKSLMYTQMAVFLALTVLLTGICTYSHADSIGDDAWELGILITEIDYPPPAGETMRVFPEPDKPDFSIMVPSPFKPADVYPENPKNVALVTLISGTTYWVNMPDDIMDWRHAGNRAVRILLPDGAQANGLSVINAQSIEIIGEVMVGIIASMNIEEITLHPASVNVKSNSEGVIVFRLDDNTDFLNNPQIGDECQIIYDNNNCAVIVKKGEG